MSDEEKIEKSLSGYWSDFLLAEFSKETDRAAIILTTSLIENALTTLLKNYLAPSSNKNDDLFDGPSVPLSDFHSKIQIAYRLGLISQKLARDLHVIRKMRNEFAHNIHSSNLESGIIKDLLTNLIYSSNILENIKEARSIFPKGARGDFLAVANNILFYLNQQIIHISEKQVKSVDIEWIYNWIYKKEPSVTSQPPQSFGNKDNPTETRYLGSPRNPKISH